MDGDECQPRILLNPQFIHREVPFFGNSENFFWGTSNEESEFKHEQYHIYIYKHIKSGNGRNVFRVCLKIL